MEKLKCLRCGAEMQFLKRESIQLGEHSFFGGDLGNLLAGSLEVEIYACPDCGKLEFFQPGKRKKAVEADVPLGTGAEHWQDEAVDTTSFYTPGLGPAVKCPRCGKEHPSDDPFCPLCGLPRDTPCSWCGCPFPTADEVCPHCGRRRKR